MKVFVLALCLCILVAAGVTWNCIYINEVCDRLTDNLEALPSIEEETCAREVERFLDNWKGEITLFSLSVSYTLTDRVSEQAEVLLACAECGDVFGFQTSLTLLRDAIDDMRRFEQISIFNLL